MNKAVLAIACGFAALIATPISAFAQTSAEAAAPVAELTTQDLAGTWVEPETMSDDDGIFSYGTENVVEVAADGTFKDGLDLTFRVREDPAYDGTYRMTSRGSVSIAEGEITWSIEQASVEPIIPDDASDEKRTAMKSLADQLQVGMQASETYRIISYDGRELAMDAGAYGETSEYVMTRR